MSKDSKGQLLSVVVGPGQTKTIPVTPVTTALQITEILAPKEPGMFPFSLFEISVDNPRGNISFIIIFCFFSISFVFVFVLLI